MLIILGWLLGMICGISLSIFIVCMVELRSMNKKRKKRKEIKEIIQKENKKVEYYYPSDHDIDMHIPRVD